ncbi:MAG: sugar ABC transporter permease, partial [Leifsonia sp.]
MTRTAQPARRSLNEARRQPRGRKAVSHKEARGAWTLMSPYLVLLMIGGIIPIAYALYISFQQSPSLLEPNKTGFGGLQAYVKAVSDFRFGQSFVDIFTVLVVWLPIMIVAVVGLALLVHASPGRFGAIMRFIYYIPGALGGVANLMLWV